LWEKHVQCVETLRVQAYFDSEVDAVSAADIERHIEHCAECGAHLRNLEGTRVMIRNDLTYSRAPPQLRARVLRALCKEETALAARSAKADKPGRLVDRSGWFQPSFWLGALGGAGATAIAATALFFVLPVSSNTRLLNDVLGAHVRSLMPSHLIDVASTDHHTVKPWFAGHTDVSPVVANFEQQSYKLIGGRADYLDHQRSAVVVYQHGQHLINVFSWAAGAGSLPRETTQSGYHMAFWKQGDLAYCAVSDAGWDELLGLVHLMRAAGTHDGRE
jgi:anti-sigma factor RsiW